MIKSPKSSSRSPDYSPLQPSFLCLPVSGHLQEPVLLRLGFCSLFCRRLQGGQVLFFTGVVPASLHEGQGQLRPPNSQAVAFPSPKKAGLKQGCPGAHPQSCYRELGDLRQHPQEGSCWRVSAVDSWHGVYGMQKPPGNASVMRCWDVAFLL